MASRPIRTNELRTKHHMSQPQVLEVLKKAKVKPVEKISMGNRGMSYLWPNREANAALRAFRDEHPAKRTAASKAKGPVRDLTAFRSSKQIEVLTEQIALLQTKIDALTEMWQPSTKVG